MTMMLVMVMMVNVMFANVDSSAVSLLVRLGYLNNSETSRLV